MLFGHVIIASGLNSKFKLFAGACIYSKTYTDPCMHSCFTHLCEACSHLPQLIKLNHSIFLQVVFSYYPI